LFFYQETPLPKKVAANRYTISPEQAKAALIRYYQALQAEFAIELEFSPLDGEHLLFLRSKIDDLECRAPWLRTQLA
jgi:hypothetical protein